MTEKIEIMVSAILLAAGNSKRMGEQDKLQLEYKGVPLVNHVMQQLLAANIEELIIVRKNSIGNLEEEFGRPFRQDAFGRIKIALNPNAALGMTSSIQAGVKLAKKETHGFMICQADMPLITTQEYNNIIAEFESNIAASPRLITSPFFQNQKGNPIILSAVYCQEILDHQEMEGCRALVRANAHEVLKVQMETNSVLVDVDTPEDWDVLDSNI